MVIGASNSEDRKEGGLHGGILRLLRGGDYVEGGGVRGLWNAAPWHAAAQYGYLIRAE
jgi:hypothetical protein